MDLISELKDAPDALRTALADSKVIEALTTFITAREKPLVDKRDELLGKNKELNDYITTAGGRDAISKLAADKAKAEQEAKDAIAKSGSADELRSHFGTEIEKREKEIQKLKDEKKEAKVKSRVSRAITDAGGNATLLGPHISQRIASEVNAEGEVVITVNKDGKPWLVGTDAKAATLKDLLEDMKKDQAFATAFSATNVNGSGAKNNMTGLTGVINPWAKETFNLTEQGKLMTQNPDLAKTLKTAAGR
jgi:hypothetical protein